MSSHMTDEIERVSHACIEGERREVYSTDLLLQIQRQYTQVRTLPLALIMRGIALIFDRQVVRHATNSRRGSSTKASMVSLCINMRSQCRCAVIDIVCSRSVCCSRQETIIMAMDAVESEWYMDTCCTSAFFRIPIQTII